MDSETTDKDQAPAVSLPRLVRDYFDEDCAPLKCPKCDSTKFTEKVLGVVDVYQGMGPTCEAEYYCECGELVGFWAYGSWCPEAMREFIANTESRHA